MDYATLFLFVILRALIFLNYVNNVSCFSQFQLIHVHVILTLFYFSSPQSFETLSTFEAWLVLDSMLSFQMIAQLECILAIKRYYAYHWNYNSFLYLNMIHKFDTKCKEIYLKLCLFVFWWAFMTMIWSTWYFEISRRIPFKYTNMIYEIGFNRKILIN